MEMMKKKVRKFVDKSAEIIQQKEKNIEKHERVLRILWTIPKGIMLMSLESQEKRVWC